MFGVSFLFPLVHGRRPFVEKRMVRTDRSPNFELRCVRLCSGFFFLLRKNEVWFLFNPCALELPPFYRLYDISSRPRLAEIVFPNDVKRPYSRWLELQCRAGLERFPFRTLVFIFVSR